MMSKSGLLAGTVSGSVVLSQLGSVMSVAQGAIKEPHGCQGSRLHPVALLVSKGCAATEAMVPSGPGLLSRVMSGTVALVQPGSVLMSMDPDNMEGNAVARGLGCQLWTCWCLRVLLSWGSGQSE